MYVQEKGRWFSSMNFRHFFRSLFFYIPTGKKHDWRKFFVSKKKNLNKKKIIRDNFGKSTRTFKKIGDVLV